MDCPVCRSTRTDPFQAVAGWEYWRCSQCRAIYLDLEHHPGAEDEAAHYRQHRNDIEDPGYRRFLSTLATPLLERLPAAQRGIDFGCGPGPALAHMVRDAGHSVALYDPVFFPDEAVLESRYDFLTCTEVVEHFHSPAESFGQLFELLHPCGLLAVMTGFPPAAAGFSAWHYRRDPTHVVFYEPATFQWIARQHGALREIPCRNVAFLALMR